jgi:E3 ubiquitin-protein ligase DOA10
MQSCRICFDEGEDLLTPCACKGSAAHIHGECLAKWLKISKKMECDVCHTPYGAEEILGSPRLLYFSQRPYWVFLALIGLVTEYHLSLHTTPIQLWGLVLFWRFELFIEKVVPTIPGLLILLLIGQAVVMAPVIAAIKNKRRYIGLVCSFTAPEGMKFCLPFYLFLLLGGLLLSFRYSIGGSIMVVHFSSFLYDIHALTVADINRQTVRAFMARIGV